MNTKEKAADVLADTDRNTSETQPSSKGNEPVSILPSIPNAPSIRPEGVFVVNANTTVDDLLAHIPLTDTRSVTEAFKIAKWNMSLALHSDGDYRVVQVPTKDTNVDLILIRYGTDDWKIDFDRSSVGRSDLKEVSEIALDLNHAVFLANELNGVTR